MPGPIIIKDPMLLFQKLDAAGDPTVDPPTDVSDDVTSVELGFDQDIGNIKTFTGSFQIPGEVINTATISCVITADTETNWGGILGLSVEARVYDRADATRYRAFATQVDVDPSLYGPTTPGEAREVDITIPVFGDIAWVAEGP
jgi:hypothetical protein